LLCAYHEFSGVRPFFCQLEAAETVIRLTEVAPQSARGKCVLDHLAAANKDANYRLEDLRSRKIQTKIETIERETNLDFLAIRSFDAHGSLESTRPTAFGMTDY
jgi:type III restriction enzyme